ncbi:MAG: GYD domain-containing protein [Dehalococcoidales bacterium]|nr:GYD domain-containing protein [Dehalococcoidales bacterium]
MAVYLMLTTLTDEGRKTVKANPERIKEVNKEVEEMGGKILTQYAVLGDYDFVNIIEAAGNTTIAKIALELSSRGTLQTTTMAAIPIDDLIASWQR